ncbi:hypothetical protein SPI_03755 [Niveomyces insectorum RCEF 264]|uniref:Uncharacterized protein n=1 Tax=Niveomyces insectorum RCEF 264 TaxID=1081102 RepID=A0A162J4J0_9HYPO|nr:hypothetical protein SPI_03755 [Niveomyces insectorum RCEF 264]
MARRMRVNRTYERAEIAVRVLALAVELASLGFFVYLSAAFWSDHASNPIAYAGVGIAILTDCAELFTFVTLHGTDRATAFDHDDYVVVDDHNHRGGPQARLAWVAFGDMTSAVLLFFSWIWLVARGMFWSCLVATVSGGGGKGDDLTNANSNGSFIGRRGNGTAPTGADDDDNAVVFAYANCDGVAYPGDALQKLSWILPFVMAAIHLTIVMLYCSGLQKRFLAR